MVFYWFWGGLWGAEGLDCGIGAERLGFWVVLFFVFVVVMVWVLSGMVGGWVWDVEGLGLRVYG